MVTFPFVIRSMQSSAICINVAKTGSCARVFPVDCFQAMMTTMVVFVVVVVVAAEFVRQLLKSSSKQYRR